MVRLLGGGTPRPWYDSFSRLPSREGAVKRRPHRHGACHTVGPYGGTLGPNLTHVASTGVTARFLHAWLSNPAKTMPGATMPRLPLSTQQIDDLTSYLLTLT